MKNLTTLFVILLVTTLLRTEAKAQEVKINHNGTDGFVVETDGTVRVEGAATTWDDLRVPLSMPSTGKVLPDYASFPYGQADPATYINWFKSSGIDEMYFVVQMPHAWSEGTFIYPHIHWSPSVSNSGAVRWGLQYAWANIGEDFPAYSTIYGTAIVPADATLTKSRMYLTPLGAGGIDGTGKKISSMLVCRIFRDGDNAADTFSGLAGALEIDFHYEVNTMGSRTEYTK